ncbi:MAG: hypothetical protein V9G98_22410 [Candidatus Competibacter sp.]
MNEMVRFILAVLATCRATHLVVHEDGPAEVFLALRTGVLLRFGDGHWVTAGINCPLCVSFWLSLVMGFMPKQILMWLAAAELARRMLKEK